MKKLLSFLLATLLLVSCFFTFTACGNENAPTTDGNNAPDSIDSSGNPTSTPTPKPDIDSNSVDVITETWVATELTFETEETSAKNFETIMDAVFTNTTTGTTITVPSFWYEKNIFKVRFAPTEYGVWEYKTVCETDKNLDGKTGTIGANEYKGDLEIYKRGFVKAEAGKKYFTYADGTPFFYLGDTHWTMLTEEFDKPGEHAGNIETDSHFKYIVDKRVEQGFTVYQSEPIGHGWNLNDCKFSKGDATSFQKADKYFAYIAEKGLVHANAQFVFGSSISKKFAEDLAFMELCCRMWVARYSAYPVMWTLAQEIDNDMYYERGDSWFSFANNPWIKVAEYLHKYDPYNHPLTGHQENAFHTTVTGKGTSGDSVGGLSVFFTNEISEITGHNWWGAQWQPALAKKDSRNATISKDYWLSNKISINYESRYCYLWTKDYGARAQGWYSYLNGFFGYGYGCIDVWYYKSTYDTTTTTSDGIEKVTPDDKAVHWSESINFPSAAQMTYMKHFFSFINWWELVPDFFDENYFKSAEKDDNYACATIGNDTYVIYLCNKNSEKTGMICGMDGEASYNAMWFNPRTAEYITINESLKANATDHNGKPAYELPTKPNGDTEDWVILLIKNK